MGMKTMSTECKRCGNLGMASHAHVAGGMCFECGRLPGGRVASQVVRATERERCIGRLAGMIAGARREHAEGTGRTWWVESREEVLARIAHAPADVAARALAAFAALGMAA